MIKGIVEYVLCCSQWKLITVGEIRSHSSVSIMLEYRWFPPKDGVYHKRLKSFLKENSCLHALPLKCDTFFNFHTVKAELFHKESREYDCSFRKNSNPLGSHVLAPLGARKWFKTSSTYLPITYNHWTSIAIIIYYSYRSTRRYLIANYLVLTPLCNQSLFEIAFQPLSILISRNIFIAYQQHYTSKIFSYSNTTSKSLWLHHIPTGLCVCQLDISTVENN